VANRPIYAAIGVTLQGERDVLGLWAGTGGEGAKFWMSVLTDLRNRGVKDLFFVVCDGLKGLAEVVVSVFPLAIVQTCLIHYSEVAVMPTPGVPALVGGGERGRRFGIITALRGRRAAGRRAGSGRGGLRLARSCRGLAA
jgi:hypothetical protein